MLFELFNIYVYANCSYNLYLHGCLQVNVEKRRLTSGVKNRVCTHSKSVKEVAVNGM